VATPHDSSVFLTRPSGLARRVLPTILDVDVALSPPADRRVVTIAVVALALLVPTPTVGVLAAMWWWPGAAGQSIYLLSKVWIVALPVWWLLRRDRARPAWRFPPPITMAMGGLQGALLAAVIVGTYGLLGSWIDEDLFRAAAARTGLDSPARYLAFGAYLCLVNALIEEIVWRWFVFRRCEALVAGARAVLLSALFFTAHHVVALAAQVPWPATVLGSAGVFAGGAAWSWCYVRYRSVWPGYVSHVIADVAILWIGWRLLFG
jgi:membrane protease YdiL (CAAX protease family)